MDAPAQNADWYEIVSGESLEQGDLLTHCPLPFLVSPVQEGAEVVVDIEYFDVVILTQSCDLANDKIKHVVCCPHFSASDTVRLDPELVKKDKLHSIRKGQQYQYLLLNSFPDALLPLALRIVDFGRPFFLPKSLVESLAASQGNRLRLRSPYREHLSQGFARFFMRVGLPQDIRLP